MAAQYLDLSITSQTRRAAHDEDDWATIHRACSPHFDMRDTYLSRAAMLLIPVSPMKIHIATWARAHLHLCRFVASS